LFEQRKMNVPFWYPGLVQHIKGLVNSARWGDPHTSCSFFTRLIVLAILLIVVLALPAAAASCSPPPAGLVGWWTGDGNASDIVGSNNGTLQGGTTATVAGMVNQAFNFDGTNGYVVIPDAAALRPTNLTIEAWVRFSGLDSLASGGSPPGDQYIVFKQNTQSGNFEGFDLGKTRLTGGDGFSFLVASATGAYVEVDSATRISTNVWYHVAAVRGSNFIQLYVNGHLETNASVSFPQNYGNFPLYFGTSGQSSWDHKFKGSLDEVSLYNRALSSNEIAAIYAAGAAGKCQPARITTQPASQSVMVGTNVTLAVAAQGTLPFSYQWQRNGTNLSDGGNLSGATTAALNLSNVQTNDSANYCVMISNVVGSVTSSVAALSVKSLSELQPQLINLPATNVQASLATLMGQVTSAGLGTPTVTLFYGPVDGGSTEGAWAQSVYLGPQSGLYAQTILGLTPNTIYYFSAKAINGAGTNWAASSLTFTTQTTNQPSPFVAVLTQHNDPSRTGANLNELLLATNNVNTNQFGLLYTRPVDDQVYAQPLIATNVNLPGLGTHNLLIVATVNDSLYAFDADDPTVAGPYWQSSFLGPNVVPPSSLDILGTPCGSFFNISGNFGIVGTPVIDPATSTMYVLARTKEYGTNFVQRLHALDITSGAERTNSPVIITATYPGTGTDNISGVITFDPFKQNQRAALALANGNVIIAWTSHCDWPAYHGWVIAYNATNLQQTAVYNDTPNGYEGGIWMSGQGPAVDPSGNIYVSTGNGSVGTSGNPSDTINRGESFLRLTLSGTNLNLTSWFTPYDWPYLESTDRDLGSAGILLIPGTSLAFSGGKEGKVYLVNRDNMGGLSGSASDDTNIIQSFQVTAVGGVDNIHGAPVWWDGPDGSYTYIQGESDYLKQYKFDRAAGQFLAGPYAQSPSTAPAGGMPGGMLAVSANGTNAGSGILWVSHPLSGDASGQVRPGILRAYDARNVAHELWNSEQLSARDSEGNFAKFIPPTVANGKVYLATFSNRINVYGLLPPPALSIRISSGNAVLSWPTNSFLNYKLQSNTNLLGGTWVNTTNNVVQTGTGVQVTLPTSGKAVFYRLKR
jgi:hypothetical protein